MANLLLWNLIVDSNELILYVIGDQSERVWSGATEYPCTVRIFIQQYHLSWESICSLVVPNQVLLNYLKVGAMADLWNECQS